MSRKFKIAALTAVAMAVAAAPLVANTQRTTRVSRVAAPTANAETTVRNRIAGFREIGAAMKTVRDGLGASELPLVGVQQAARQLRASSQAMHRWFPAGSGPRAGLKTRAKPEIWTNAAEFRAAQDNFGRRVDAFQAAVATGNSDNIRAAFGPLGGSCKGCHDKFQEPEKK